jgi:hypothetical protein
LLFIEVCYLIALFLVDERTEVKQRKSRVVCFSLCCSVSKRM